MVLKQHTKLHIANAVAKNTFKESKVKLQDSEKKIMTFALIAITQMVKVCKLNFIILVSTIE